MNEICIKCNKEIKTRTILGLCKTCYEISRRPYVKWYSKSLNKLKISYYANKQRAVDLLGGKKCKNCGVDNLPLSCYDFHHLQNKKELISKLLRPNNRFVGVEQELTNCIVLCANCHRKHHFEIEAIKLNPMLLLSKNK